ATAPLPRFHRPASGIVVSPPSLVRASCDAPVLSQVRFQADVFRGTRPESSPVNVIVAGESISRLGHAAASSRRTSAAHALASASGAMRSRAAARLVGPLGETFAGGSDNAAVSRADFPVLHQVSSAAKLPTLTGSSGGRLGNSRATAADASCQRVASPTIWLI